MKNCWIALVAVVLCSACASTMKPERPVHPGPIPDLDIDVKPRALSEGSLYNGLGSAELASDFRARHIGDVLIVRVTENSTGSSSADSTLNKSATTNLAAPTIFGLENRFSGRNFNPALALDTNTQRAFNGDGETTRQNSLLANIAVRVLAVGTGGRMIVAGKKEIEVNRELQTLTLVGIVRPEDVRANNTIASSAVADLRITYGGTGDVADMTRQGWFQRMVDKIWPF